jgi:hypothetical protein
VAFERARKVISSLARLDHEQQCELLYFDESGFSPNPPVQYGWGKIGQTRTVEPLAHRQRVNVLGLCTMMASWSGPLSSGRRHATM